MAKPCFTENVQPEVHRKKAQEDCVLQKEQHTTHRTHGQQHSEIDLVKPNHPVPCGRSNLTLL
jgi:hypothetical protein